MLLQPTYSAKKGILVWNIYRLAADAVGEARTACPQKIPTTIVIKTALALVSTPIHRHGS
jgi:hypothetical protein